jgi:hypothetical protein
LNPNASQGMAALIHDSGAPRRNQLPAVAAATPLPAICLLYFELCNFNACKAVFIDSHEENTLYLLAGQLAISLKMSPSLSFIRVVKVVDSAGGVGGHYRGAPAFLESLKRMLEPLQSLTALNVYPTYRDGIKQQVEKIQQPIDRFEAIA